MTQAIVRMSALLLAASIAVGCSQSSTPPSPAATPRPDATTATAPTPAAQPSTPAPDSAAPVAASHGEPYPADSANPLEKAAAGRAAQAFLELIDSGQDEAARARTSAFFQRMNPAQRWQSQVGSMRSLMGAVRTRRIAGVAVTDVSGEEPPGRYYAVDFDSTFEKGRAREMVMLGESSDGWHIVGWFTDNSVPQ